MGVKSINKAIIVVILVVLLSQFAYAQAVSSDTAILNQINDRLAQNKAEIIKAVRDAQAQSQNETNSTIDQNFKVLDTRIQDFLDSAKRDIAIIMVASFLVAFAISQIIRVRIERSGRRAQIKRVMELEVLIEAKHKEAQDLVAKVTQLKELNRQYSTQLKGLTKKAPFITIQAILLAIITFCLGAGVVYLVAR